MGPKTTSGFYLSRTSAALLALLLAALLLALVVLGALYARTRVSGEGEGHPSISSFTDNSTWTSSFSATPTPGTTDRPGIWDNLRLPNYLVPLHYDLELWPKMYPDSEDNVVLSGQVNISMECVEMTDVVLLHSDGLNISRAQLKLVDNPQAGVGNRTPQTRGAGNPTSLSEDSIGIKDLWNSKAHQYLVLELERPLVAKRHYVLELDYSGYLSNDYSGLFFAHYKDFGIDKVLIASELEPTSARAVYPCFDEPALKATFKTRIVHNSSYVALSNMPAIAMSEREDADGTKWTVTTFNTTLKMSTYITAFVICDFDYISTTERGNEIRIWARKEAVQKGYASFALSIAGPILSYLEDLLNVTYPLQKTDFVAIPKFGVGAMENWGLITFQEPSLIYNPNQKFSDAKALICLIVAHEIGHQWFGNLVTMKWWNDIWLNEGFASYMEFIGASFINSKLKLNEMFLVHNLLYMFERDSTSTLRALSVKGEDIQTMDDIMPLFDMFTYNKGAALVRMVTSFLNDKLFLKGISSYLKTFSYSNADQDDLWNHLQMVIDDQDEVQLPAPLRQIMDSWTWQEGLPLLTLNTSTGRLTEEQFKVDNSDNITSDSNHTWIVPVSWIKNGIQQPMVWLTNRSNIFPGMKFASDDKWIVLNINVTGYYRINYDEEHWNRLAKQLEKDHKVFPLVNRVQLIDDAFMLAKAGYIQYETALDLTKYLKKEDEVIVWNTVLKHFMSIHNPFINYDSFPLIKKYLLHKMNPIFQHYASMVRRNFDESADDYFIHTIIDDIFKAACSLGLQDCLDLASELFNKWMNNQSTNAIPYSIRNSISCYAIAHGDEKQWEFAWNILNKSMAQDHVEHSYLKQALCCTKEPWLIHRYLQNTLEENSPSALAIILSMATEDIGGHIAWDFLKENWQRTNIPLQDVDFFHKTLLPAFGWKIISETQYQEVQDFIIRTSEGKTRNNLLEKLESYRRANLQWINTVNTQIIVWLRKNTEESDL
ncbi:aminopeptidase Q [Spea bombifrons]|uniref:aminopeptidase Q n=1 Tax=Spea bombifrons TaxID=233779 RepID=UPI00234A225F|nr:aminopeptidase Q [Spea bombifrons]